MCICVFVYAAKVYFEILESINCNSFMFIRIETKPGISSKKTATAPTTAAWLTDEVNMSNGWRAINETRRYR